MFPSPSRTPQRQGPPTFKERLTSITLKPRRNEAIARLRHNAAALIALFVAVSMLPLPSPAYCYSKGPMPSILCSIESLVILVLTLNILQAAWALKFPPPAYPPLMTPAKPSMAARNGTKKVGSHSLSRLTQGNPSPASFSSSYATTPISTPSRSMAYSTLSTRSQSALNQSTSSTSSLPPTPSPSFSALSAYRSRHGTAVGRAFDESSLLDSASIDT